MKEIPLNIVEKQSLSVLLDNSLFELSFKTCNGITAATVIKDGVTLVENRRVVAGVPIIPEGSRETSNFIILTNNNELPYYSNFSSTHILVYMSQQEVNDIRIQLSKINIRKPVKNSVVPKPAIKQPKITQQPGNTTIDSFNKLTLTVKADNALSYQWRKNGIIIPNQSGSSLTIDSVQVSDSGQYQVIVSGEKYSSAVASNTVTVNVNAPAKPSFISQPKNLLYPVNGPYRGVNVVLWPEGGNLKITGAVTKDVSSYQWQFLPLNGSVWQDLDNQTKIDLNLISPIEGSYRLVLTNSTGQTSSEVFAGIEAFLFLQNDSSTIPTAKYSLTKLSNTLYDMVDPSVSSTTSRPIGAFIRRPDTPNVNIDGFAVVGPTSVSSDMSVVTANAQATGRQTSVIILKTGYAEVNIKFGPLSSTVKITVK